MVVCAIDESVDGSALTVRFGDVERVIHVDAVADVDAARRWRNACRRVDSIEMVLSATGIRFTLCGAGHRLPVRRRVSPSVALGLATTGCPVTVRDVAR